jgi:hypothetical protein
MEATRPRERANDRRRREADPERTAADLARVKARNAADQAAITPLARDSGVSWTLEGDAAALAAASGELAEVARSLGRAWPAVVTRRRTPRRRGEGSP